MAETEFRIHAISVLDGMLAVSPLPGRSQPYEADWQRLLAWKPDVVISMTQQSEFAAHGAGTLGKDLGRAGIEWRHLPVVDFGVPDQLDWPAVRDDVLGILGRSGRVLVHCFGGCGRSGMMVLRLMIAAGEDADVALARLRAIRPCAVETDAQMNWARLG